MKFTPYHEIARAHPPTKKLHVNGTSGGITFYPNVAPVVMNTTSQNLSISSAGGSVIIQLG